VKKKGWGRKGYKKTEKEKTIEKQKHKKTKKGE
jgi:hypothetical protein